MKTFEINKIVGAVLVTALAVTIINFAGNFLAGAPAAPEMASAPATAPAKAPEPAAKPETRPKPETTPPATAKPDTATKPAEPALAARLAAASAGDGQKYAKKCRICHDLKKGGRHKVGPNLWDVVGKAKASAPGYRYSPGLKAKGGAWTYADLDAYLTKPKDFVPKSKMTFRVKKPKDRANLIVYLRTLSDQPKPLPGQ